MPPTSNQETTVNELAGRFLGSGSSSATSDLRSARARFRSLLVVALLAAGTSLALSASATAAAPPIPWHKCTDPAQKGFQCAKIRVPLDYDHPRGKKIHLALIRHRATDPGRRVRTIFYEPGGPGVGGTDYLPALAYEGFPARVRERFDIVSWDPRGVGASTAVKCFASEKAEQSFFAGSGTRNVEGFPIGRDQMTTWIDRYRDFGKRCKQRNGRLLRHVSTVDTVRDLDLMRRRAGERKLNFLGTSYGTMVGAVYANTFPDRVRRMVFDGNVNPVGWTRPQRKQNDGRFLPGGLRFKSDVETTKTFDAFLDLCGSTDTAHCAFSAGSPKATKEKFTELLEQLPEGVPPGQTSRGMAIAEVPRALVYTPNWAAEASDLQKLWEDGPSAVPPQAFGPDDQEMSVVCGEVPTPKANAFPGIDAFARARSAVFGPFWAWDYELCSTWPVRAAHRYTGPWNRRTANPVLVIGNTFDPATPLRGAVAMSKKLDRARLLKVDGYGHTTLINPSACVHRHESRYFIRGILPPKGTRCAQDEPPFSTLPTGSPARESSAASADRTSAHAARRALPKRTRAKLRRLIRRFKQTNHTPGVLIDIWGPKGRYVRAKGVADLATGKRLDKRMQFKIASLTKGFTATLILQLVGKGKLSLGDHISDWIAGVPNGDEITIRMLLNHTSGLGDGFLLPAVQQKLATGCTPDFLLAAEAKAPPIAAPGAEWNYNNYGYNLLGRVVELATGQDLSTAIQKRIAKPLGLRRTYLPTSITDDGLSAPFAHGYSDTYPTQRPIVADDATALPVSCFWAHGGMVSTLADMRVFIRAQATG